MLPLLYRSFIDRPSPTTPLCDRFTKLFLEISLCNVKKIKELQENFLSKAKSEVIICYFIHEFLSDVIIKHENYVHNFWFSINWLSKLLSIMRTKLTENCFIDRELRWVWWRHNSREFHDSGEVMSTCYFHQIFLWRLLTFNARKTLSILATTRLKINSVYHEFIFRIFPSGRWCTWTSHFKP